MAGKADDARRPRAAAAATPPSAQPSVSHWQATPPWALADRLECIQAMGKRIDSYIQFICQIPSFNGTSAEAKDRAVTAFYERLVVAERQLGRVQEDLRLE